MTKERTLKQTSLAQEAKISLGTAASLPELQIDGKAPNQTCLWRWAREGLHQDGRTVYLESLKIGGRLVTSREAVHRFLEALQDGMPAAECGPANRLEPLPILRISRARASSLAEAQAMGR